MSDSPSPTAVFVLGVFADASGFGGVTCEPATVGYDVFSEATARDPHV
ncbi:hypothetical protein OG819_56660 [Streptomyces sp. NBC_01549]|nr:hypothetical protein [Streptomyces sp. NBC_01549]MCX4598566.1 hypothetical protein [Streptomyces sp. NBC_01549]